MQQSTEVPRYRLLAPLWDSSDCQLWPEGTVVSFVGVPNDHMEPLNGEAERRLRQHLDHLDKLAEIKAAMDGRAFQRRAGDLADAVAEEYTFEKRRSEIPRSPAEPVPVRPDLVSAAEQRRRARGRPKMVMDAQLPEAPKMPDGVGRVVPILGTDYTRDATSPN